LLHAHKRTHPDGDGPHFHSPLESAIVSVIRRGGDTDTNASICGGLLGAVYGSGAIPPHWGNVMAECRPESGRKDVRRARPPEYWPVDAAPLARAIATTSRP
jgi:hypothetical protein